MAIVISKHRASPFHRGRGDTRRDHIQCYYLKSKSASSDRFSSWSIKCRYSETSVMLEHPSLPRTYSTGQRDGSITRAFHACKDAILHAISTQNTRKLHAQNTRVKKYTQSASKIYTQSASKISENLHAKVGDELIKCMYR